MDSPEYQPSLRDSFMSDDRFPSDKSLGYCPLSLRDKEDNGIYTHFL